MIIYHKGDLFTAQGENNLLVHACNCRGVWGSGVAAEFKKRYPEQFKDYENLCMKYGDAVLGMGIQYHQLGEQSVGYLFTSDGFGKEVDTPEQILKNTRKAVRCIIDLLPKGVKIHSPKINSGLFKVPWADTEKVINEVLAKYPGVEWHVWEL